MFLVASHIGTTRDDLGEQRNEEWSSLYVHTQAHLESHLLQGIQHHPGGQTEFGPLLSVIMMLRLVLNLFAQDSHLQIQMAITLLTLLKTSF